MTVWRAVATIVGCTLLIAALGAGVGCALGTFAPCYFRSVFRNGLEPGFDPVAVGVGQGLTQGTAGGVVVGLYVVALLCWREVQLRPAEESAVEGSAARASSTVRRVLLVVGSALVLGFCFCSGLVGGLLQGTGTLYHLRYREEQEAIAPVLAGDPAFARVEVYEISAGGAYLSGEVPTPEDLDRLRAAVARAVGERRARDAMIAVSVKRW